MKKRQQLITGILISAMAFSTITKPEVVQASPQKSVSAYELQQKERDLEHNQTAIDFISYCDENQFRTWDQSLGALKDEDAKEIEKCVAISFAAQWSADLITVWTFIISSKYTRLNTAKKNIGTTNAASTVTLPSEVNEDALFDKEMTFIWERCVKKESFSFLFCF